MSELKPVSTFLQALIDDEDLLNNIMNNIQEIMKDGKVTSSDIPEIFSIVMECTSNLSKFNLTYEEIPQVLEELVNYIFDKFNLLPEGEEEDFKKMIDMVIKLVMLQPKVKKGLKNLWSKLTSCCRKNE